MTKQFKFSQKLISDLAQEVDTGMICHVNLDTGEYETILGDSYSCHYDEDDDIDQEIYDKIDSWNSVARVDPLMSEQSFRIMEAFVEQCIPEQNPLAELLYKALSRSKPFSRFKAIVDNSDYREEWFAFKQQQLEKHVAEELGILTIE